METTIVYRCHIGIMEKKKMETTRVYWCCIGKLDKKLETTILSLGFRIWLLGFRAEVLRSRV